MSQQWITKEEDLDTARKIMEAYAVERDCDTLGLFELVVDKTEKKMNFRLSGWVVSIARHFSSTYGARQGDFITRQVLTSCITQGRTLH